MKQHSLDLKQVQHEVPFVQTYCTRQLSIFNNKKKYMCVKCEKIKLISQKERCQYNPQT